ncbi:Sec1-like protein [Entophlyctis helioformis]|nr:Sec1-like protein [Entophlyctis helioformis]
MPFSTAALREVSRRELIRVLDSLPKLTARAVQVRGKKALIIDPSVSGPLSLVAEFSVLKEHGVDKIYYLSAVPLQTDNLSLVYITRPNLMHMKWIASQARLSARDPAKRSPDSLATDITVFFVPRRTLLCDRILEEEGVFGDITIGEYHLDLVPLEDDLLSLELDAFKPLLVDGDTTAVHAVAHALLKLQVLYGSIPRILGKGDAAKVLVDLLSRMRSEYSIGDQLAGQSSSRESDFDSILVIDRSVDLISPLRTQLTYEGLIDELFSIKSSFAEINTPVMLNQVHGAVPPANSKPKKLALNNRDRVFADIRNLGFEVVGGVLGQIGQRIQQEEDDRHNMKTPSQLKDFAAKIGGLQLQRNSLSQQNTIYDEILRHAGDPETAKRWAAEEAICAGAASTLELDYVDELISRQMPISLVLRLLCMQCLAQSGLKPKVYDAFRKSITYGYTHVPTLQNLRKAGLLYPQDPAAAKGVYPQILKLLRLKTDYDSDQAVDPSYVFHGYAPISVRLVQAACRGGAATSAMADGASAPPTWKGCEDVLRNLPGASVEDTVSSPDKSFRKKSQQSAAPLTLVVFLGGCTMAEVAALRFLSEKDSMHRGFVVLTTGVTTGTRLVDSLLGRSVADLKNLAH